MKKQPNNLGLYLHIPFCHQICPYCGFSKYLRSHAPVEAYLEAMQKELSNHKAVEFSSIYIGGGTPSCLQEHELSFLFSMLEPYVRQGISFTIEANPNDITDKLAHQFVKAGINRVSLGIQRLLPQYQAQIQREIDPSKVEAAIACLQNAGISNINVDLLYGLSEDSLEAIQKEAALFVALPVQHISIYCLQIERGTTFFHQKRKEASDELAREQYDFLVSYLKQHGFQRYEVSNFARPGYESEHNLLYWRNQPYIGIGLSAASYWQGKRRTNTTSMQAYLRGDFIKEEETVDKNLEQYYYLALALRLEDGFLLSDFKKNFQQDFLTVYHDALEKPLVKQQLKIEQGRVRLKEDAFFTMNAVLVALLYA